MNDTSVLLKETSSGCKYATESIKIAKDYAKGRGMLTDLEKYRTRHEQLRDRISEQMKARGTKEQRHPTIGAAMTKVHMNVSLTLNPEDRRIAELMINGCNMGMKTIAKIKNRHEGAAEDSVRLADELIKTEQDMIDDMLKYLK